MGPAVKSNRLVINMFKNIFSPITKQATIFPKSKDFL